MRIDISHFNLYQLKELITCSVIEWFDSDARTLYDLLALRDDGRVHAKYESHIQLIYCSQIRHMDDEFHKIRRHMRVTVAEQGL